MAWFDAGHALGEWTLGDLLETSDGDRLSHVRHATHGDGRQGVAKIIRGGRGGIGRVRLQNEIDAMRRLNGNPGILPVLASSTEERAYLITPLVATLREHLGHQPKLRDVVETFADLAETLAALHDVATFHRDLKPENLFWNDGRAVLGDFGLVLDPRVSNVDITAEGDMVGSIYFMAPEARSRAAHLNWGLADVYSLAMCLWVLAREVRWPPHSTLWAREPDVSLYYQGGKAAHDLAALLQMATEAAPRDRMGMVDFANELQVWLRLHPTASRLDPPKIGHYVGRQMEARAAAGGVAGRASRSLQMLARDVVELLPESWGEVSHEEAPGRILQPPDITGGHPDWEPDWGPVTLAREFVQAPQARLVIELVGRDDEWGYYLAEWQLRELHEWVVAWRLSDPAQVRPRFPSDRDLCRVLAAEISNGAPSLH